MPGVTISLENQLYLKVNDSELADVLQKIVSKAMSCLVPDPDDPSKLHRYQMRSDEVHIEDIDKFIRAEGIKAILEVKAYPYASRMDDIDKRMERIGGAVRRYLGLEEGETSLTFLPVQERCWVRV